MQAIGAIADDLRPVPCVTQTLGAVVLDAPEPVTFATGNPRAACSWQEDWSPRSDGGSRVTARPRHLTTSA